MSSASEQGQSPPVQLMDREWERVQTKTFTHWTNSHLRKRNQQIKDITVDMRDGKMLNILLEVISGERLPKPESGKMRVHQVMNVSKCLNFVISKGVKLVGIGAEEIVDGNVKMTLGMIWTIILRFALPDTDPSMSARDGLLLWCQKKTEPYNNVNIVNFSNSWRDGLAFCAIIHRHRPELINYDELRKDQAKHNLELAFKVADEHLDIPVMLDIDDLLNMPPDEKSVMTYVSCYYQAFSTSHELETASNLLRKALDSHDENLKRMKEFEELSSQISEWLDKTTPEIASRDEGDNSHEHFKNMKQDLLAYKSQVKPKWSDEKTRLQNAFNSLQTLLRINNRPEYVAPEHLNVGTIEKKWKQLGKEEVDKLAWINLNLKRIEDLEFLVKKYNNKCHIHEEWASDKVDILKKEITAVELNDLMILQRRNETFLGELSSQDSRIKTIKSLLEQLKPLNYSKIDVLQSRHDAIIETFEVIKSSSSDFTSRLQTKVDNAQQLEQLRVKYAKEALILVGWLNQNIEDLGDGYLAQSVADVNSLLESHQKLIESLDEYKSKTESLVKLEQEIMNITRVSNPYTNHTSESINAIWGRLESEISERDSALDQTLKVNQQRETVGNQIVAKSNEIENYQQQTREKIFLTDGTLEDKHAHTKSFVDTVNQYHDPQLKELAALIEGVDVLPLFVDPEIMTTTQNNYRSLLDTILAEVNLIENQILIRDSSNITEQQMNEYKKAFAHFDKDNLGYLNQDQFRNFLVSLSYNCTPGDPKGEHEFEQIRSNVDPNNTDQFNLSSFLNYLATTTKGENNIEEMIKSFKVIASGKPYITEDELKRELGEKASEYAKQMTPYTKDDAPAGALDYVAYAESIYGGSDL